MDGNEIIGLLQKPGVKLKLEKCKFLKRKVIYMGHTISLRKLASAVEPTKGIIEASFPTDKTQLRFFLGA